MEGQAMQVRTAFECEDSILILWRNPQINVINIEQKVFGNLIQTPACACLSCMPLIAHMLDANPMFVNKCNKAETPAQFTMHVSYMLDQKVDAYVLGEGG